ncbi:hypothetical protein ACA30_01930 [Virgibacillus soli]|nr:hypothetical protein ACA30_01930 [Virgibacillus soli]
MILSLAVIVAVSLANPSLAAEESEADIQAYVKDMQPGWNLGNTFDAVGADETAWGNPHVTEEFIKHVADQGFKSIRIPVTFDGRQAAGPDYIIDADFLERLDQVIQWSLAEDLYVMINIHHDSWIWLSEGMHHNHDETLARFEETWKQLAEHFKDYSSKLMFESINEPQFNGTEQEQFEYLQELNTAFHQIVRESGGKNDTRPLVLPTLLTGSEPEKLSDLYETITELNDPNIISTVHYYGFWPFSVNIAGYTRFEEDTKNEIISVFDRVHDTFVAKGIPVIIGEYGLLGFDTDMQAIEQGEKLKFFEFMIYYAQEKELTHMLWDNGQHFGRTSYEWSDPALYQLMKASWTTRSATAESDFIYIKNNEEIEDQSLKLDLNGNQFISLLLDEEKLLEGRDYLWDGQQLTFKADLLKYLTEDGHLGTNAILTAKFNQGADWHFHIKTYETPTLDKAEGTVANFSIPTSFNGAELATMEAFYTDGEVAGPQDWTPFKEFGYTFSPDYEKDKMIMKEAFFNEATDGEIELTFHFWSGEKIPYTLTKDGNTVRGETKTETLEEEKPAEGGDKNPPRDNEQPKDKEKPSPIEKPDNEDDTSGNKVVPGNEEPRREKVPNDKNDNQPAEIDVAPVNERVDGTSKPNNDRYNRLPNTATNLYNYLFLGLAFVLIGGILALYFRKRKIDK